MDSGDIFDSFAIERSAKELFGVAIEVNKTIVRRVDAGKAALATVFLTDKKQLYCYIDGPSKLLFGDVKKIISRMGLTAEMYFPPKGRPHYFDEIGEQKFRQVFPSRKEVTPEDIIFYRTLAPYSPALVAIGEVKDGTIYQADHDARGGWRPAIKFAYRRIKTS